MINKVLCMCLVVTIGLVKTKGVSPHVRPRSRSRQRSRPRPQSIQYCSRHVYPLARSRLHLRSRSHSCSCSHSRSCYSAISLVIESECKRTGTDADAHVDTLLKDVNPETKCEKCEASVFSLMIYTDYQG